MNIFHKHDWREIARAYAPPVSIGDIEGILPRDLQRLIAGVTTIIWECNGCHEIRKEEMLGAQTTNLKEKK